ncbi:D-Ala-D-Ala carboxypeptidase family metallohydrolase [Cohaesibacter celericrescens]|uniref:Peptidase M15A C-terminal domain-containing protein n=1 Tax=Cohaesibacter celericrescens TaxID=2067669 RepID=A0A2N5XX23_9HYPH|nr:D-Ala-D-Ala carboxypeptidase family metallohydrolase [Cohaesibacter celericrescens]PLW79060.1 hypothetical protein C0081_02180 [Cohaesibacter celericrescens]
MQGMSFEQFYAGFGFKYFTAAEILTKGTSHVDPDDPGFGLNTDPPPELWWNIIATVRALEWLRADIDEPISLLSGYRSPAYNKAIGGAAVSQHMNFTALDFYAKSKSPGFCFNRLKYFRSQGGFTGGLGLYSWGVHVDTRGVNKDW